jgi:hypothetical protein
MITKDQVASLLTYSPDTGQLTWLVDRGRTAKAGQVAGCKDTQGYVCLKINSRIYKAHRVAWLLVYGRWPDSQLDHINGVPGDNRIANLREVSPQQNAENRRVTHTDPGHLKGVSYMRKIRKWVAKIHNEGVAYYLGVFSTPEEAHAAYRAAALVLHTHSNLTNKNPDGSPKEEL